MTRERFPDESLDQIMTAWLDERAHGPGPEAVLDAVLARTTRTRPLPGWLLAERWLPMRRIGRRHSPLSLVPVLLVVSLLLAIAIAIFAAGSQRRLPPPFGLAAPGAVAFIADGHVWTANADGSRRTALTSDPRIAASPTFSRDGTRIAFKRLPVADSTPDWQDWGDVIVADADGRNPIVIHSMLHSPSPLSWSPDSRSIVYSGTVGNADQVFVAAADGSARHQVTDDAQSSWGPTLAPDGRTIAFVRGTTAPYSLYVIQTDGTGERRITSRPLEAFDLAEWSPNATTTTLLFAARHAEGNLDVLAVGLDGQPERAIRATPDDDSGSAWSPDAASIAYVSGNAANGYRQRVVVARADGSDPVAISEIGDWSWPQWSPDALHVLAVDRRLSGGQPIVAVLDPAGREPAATFALADVPGFGRADFPSWQRLALP